MLVLGIQYGGEKFHPHAGGMLGPLLLIVAGACAGAILIPSLGFVTGRGRTLLARRRADRRRIRNAATAEQRTRAMMTELCPFGWRAHITLTEGVAAHERAEPVSERPGAVAIDWYELMPGGGEPRIVRRVWGATVAEALDAMVSDRRTDETLEQIELRASADGALWPDL